MEPPKRFSGLVLSANPCGGFSQRERVVRKDNVTYRRKDYNDFITDSMEIALIELQVIPSHAIARAYHRAFAGKHLNRPSRHEIDAASLHGSCLALNLFMEIHVTHTREPRT